jgi:tetratricopeptide (TPR) repeat protein
MKRVNRILLVCLCLICLPAGLAIAADVNAEVDAVKKVIIAETESWAKKDYDAWQNAWYQGPDAISVYISKYFHQEKNGWDEISSAMKIQMKENPDPLDARIVRENFQVRVDGNLAWATYDEKYIMKDETARRREWPSRQLRTLVKQDGAWLIASLTGIDSYGYGADFDEIEWDLNMTGHRLLDLGKVSEAIELFSMIVTMYPDSPNAYESLAEAYTAEGDIDLAVENYLKAQELDPESKNAGEMLEKLKRERKTD